MAKIAIFLPILALNFISIVFSFDTSPLQDFCVADLTSKARIDGLPCKDPATVTVTDFSYSGLDKPGNTSNSLGAGFQVVSVNQVPGLNTLGLYLGRLDLQPKGYVPPHYHPRGTEIVTVLEGSIEMRFITSYPDYKHFYKTLGKGDFFAVPVGLLHYVRHVGTENAVVLWAINSQNPGVTTVTGGVFGVNPPMNSDYLSQAYYLDKKAVEQLQTKFSSSKF